MDNDPSAIRVIEIAIAAIFIILIILISVLVVNSSSSSSKLTITNSYNTYNYNINVNQNSYQPNFQSYPAYETSSPASQQKLKASVSSRYLNYNSWSDYKVVSGILGNPIANYEVYIENEENIGGYFKVVYYFKDYGGNTNSASEIYYLEPHETQKILYNDVSPSKYKYQKWWYEVDSLTKITNNVGYNN